MTEFTELAPPCEAATGHHVCITHDQHFQHNLEANNHEREHTACVFAWSCNEHGMERPT